MKYNNLSKQELVTLIQDKTDMDALEEIIKRFEYGNRYPSAEIFPQDLKKAYDLYVIQAEVNGNDYFKLAYKVLYGESFEQSGFDAFDLFCKCGPLLEGHDICLFLARANALGLALPPNFKKCAQLIYNLFKNGKNTEYLTLDLGLIYYYGFLRNRNMDKAMKYFMRFYEYLKNRFETEIKKFSLQPEAFKVIESLDKTKEAIKDLLTNSQYCRLKSEIKDIEFKIPEYLLSHCHSEGSGKSWYKVAFATEYGLEREKRNMKIAISYYKQSYDLGFGVSGLRLIDFYKNSVDQFLYYKNTFRYVIYMIELSIRSKNYINGSARNAYDDMLMSRDELMDLFDEFENLIH